MSTKTNQYIESIGIKGDLKQLPQSTEYLCKVLHDLKEPCNFSVEIHIRDNYDLEKKNVRDNFVKDFIKIAEKHREECGKNFTGVTLHTPFRIKNIDSNLLTFDDKIWNKSLEIIKIVFELSKQIENKTKIKSQIVFHAYSLHPFETRDGKITNTNKLYQFCNSYRKTGVEDALKTFSKEERERMGIEMSGAGPFSTPDEFISLAKKLGCFIVQDVGHLTKYCTVDKNGKIHDGKYKDIKILKEAVRRMTPYTKHWHICQHHGNSKHEDWHLAKPGIINWPELIPYILKSFKENNATAIIEVESKEYAKPLAGIGSLLLFREMLKEKL